MYLPQSLSLSLSLSLFVSLGPLVELETVSSVKESAGSKTVCVVLHPNAPQTIVSLSLRVDGVTGPSLSFSTSGRQCASVTVTDDRVVEYDETLHVELANSGSGVVTILPSSIYIPVEDDDSECVGPHKTTCIPY